MSSVCFSFETWTAASLSLVQELVNGLYEIATNGHSGNHCEKNVNVSILNSLIRGVYLDN